MSENARKTAQAAKDFWLSMKSQPRSPKHGNRKPSPPAHGDPVDGASPQYVRTGLPSPTWRTLNAGVAIDPAQFHSLPAPDPSLLKSMQDMVVAQMARMMGAIPEWPPELAPPPPIPHAGIRAGEIIGYRLWWVHKDGRLRSLVQDEVVWDPVRPMTGDVEREVFVHPRTNQIRYAGVYAYKDRQRAKKEFYYACSQLKTGRWYGPVDCSAICLGSVKLWGEVVEHEEGWRASFARVHEIVHIHHLEERPMMERRPQAVYNIIDDIGPVDSSTWTG